MGSSPNTLTKNKIMDFNTFKNLATVEKFNTNNAWGFGGASGKRYTYKDAVLCIGKTGQRHGRSCSYLKAKIGDTYYQSKGEFLNNIKQDG